MRTISKKNGKNFDIEVKGNFHKYPDGTIFEVKQGKLHPTTNPGGGGGGVSSYNDLTDAPMNVEQGAFYTPETKSAEGSFGPTKLIKVSDAVHSLFEIVGAEITMTNGELIATTANTSDASSIMGQVGATGSIWNLVSVSGNWMENFDAAFLSTDGEVNLDMGGGTKLELTPGTWISEDVISVVLPDHMVVNPTYESLFLPEAGALKDGSGLVVSAGKWIVSAPGSVTGIADYRNIQRIMDNGDADKVFPLWSQIKATHADHGDILFDVVNYDSTSKELTLLMHDIIDGFEFDDPEAMCVCPSGLAAGTYNLFNVQFTLTKAVPAGGVIVFDLDYSRYQSVSISTFPSLTSLEPIETVSFSDGTGGTALSTVLDAGDINDEYRARYGNGNYYQSSLRQYLNASGDDWWQPMHKFDRPPAYASRKGFLSGFNEQFVALLATTNRVCATNQSYEIGNGPDGNALAVNSSYTVAGKFFLPSLTELDGEQNNNVAEGAVFQAFQNAGTSNSDLRVKYTKDGRPWYYWERSCSPWNSISVGYVNGSGHPGGDVSAYSRNLGFAAACVIKGI